MNAGEALPWHAAALSALSLGLVTAVSPCPLATNIAAMSYLARFSSLRRRQLLAGALYAFGRAAAYAALGGALVFGLLSAPVVSDLLQRHMDALLGPLLLAVGMALLGFLPGLPAFGGVSSETQHKLIDRGMIGGALLGFAFALAFCPVSAALFFGSLVPLAIRQQSPWVLPCLFGIGSAAPVLLFGIALVLSRELAGRWFARAQTIDRWLVPATGWVLTGLGVYLCATRTLCLFPGI
ncbi:MAG: aromatic aminobenezylarsenical efflux permease ArsG family transporter [Planctomycetota bacterium]